MVLPIAHLPFLGSAASHELHTVASWPLRINPLLSIKIEVWTPQCDRPLAMENACNGWDGSVITPCRCNNGSRRQISRLGCGKRVTPPWPEEDEQAKEHDADHGALQEHWSLPPTHERTMTSRIKRSL